MGNNNIIIKHVRDCWGCFSYFGYKDGKQYTDSYDMIEDLREENREFNNCIVQFKNNANRLLKITDNNNLLFSDTIEQLKEYNEGIYWSDSRLCHWIYNFKINDVWFESTNINNELTVIELNAFK